MECEQLVRLIKEWYLQVRQETMAPARMMRFVDQHVKNCPVCAKDLLLPEEIEKVREIVYPEAKIIPPAQEADGMEDEELEERQDDDEFGGTDDGLADEESEDGGKTTKSDFDDRFAARWRESLHCWKRRG